MSGDAFKAFETGAWHDRARTYDLVIGAVTARVGEELLDAVAAGPGTRLLDVGCGPGTITAAAAARGARAVGVDLAAGMLALGRERHPGLELLEADAEALPFPDDAFDALVGGFVLNHLPAVETAIAEAARVLAPGGRMAVAVWDRPDRNRLLGELTAAVRDADVAVRGGLPDGPDPYRLADPAEMEALLGCVRGHGGRRRGRSCSCTRPTVSTSCGTGCSAGRRGSRPCSRGCRRRPAPACARRSPSASRRPGARSPSRPR